MKCLQKSSSKIQDRRFKYAVAALLLIAVEVLIALFVHDRFVRPFVGDMLVVVVIWAMLRVVFPDNVRLLSLYVFIFAAGVELLQLCGIVDLLGIARDSFLGILIGSTFDAKDIACYAVGCAVTAVIDAVVFSRRSKAA